MYGVPPGKEPQFPMLRQRAADRDNGRVGKLDLF